MGTDTDGIEVQDLGGEVVVSGTVDDIWTRDRILAALRVRMRAPVHDRVCVNPDWGEEAQAKQTEFGNQAATRAMTWPEFAKID
jgi:hypothetical protein